MIDTDINVGTKKWRLQQIQNGEAWTYIEYNFLRKLRSGTTCIILYKADETTIVTLAERSKSEILMKKYPKGKIILAHNDQIIKKPLFTIKTNLLADVLTLVNIELEVPIGQRWSVSGELMSPWWRNSNSDCTLQVLFGSGSVKYWFGDRSRHDVMTGWYLGLYGDGGKYDMQLFEKDGTQGEFFSTGLQGGYAHKISKNLRLEYSLSFGFIRSNYKEYTRITDTKYGDIKVFEYPWEIKRLDQIAPTNAKVIYSASSPELSWDTDNADAVDAEYLLSIGSGLLNILLKKLPMLRLWAIYYTR